MQPLTQGYKPQQLLQVGVLWKPYYIPHVEHEAMLFTVWLNPQIVLISATVDKTNDPLGLYDKNDNLDSKVSIIKTNFLSISVHVITHVKHVI